MTAQIGTWSDVMGKAAPEVQAIAERLRAEIKAAHPDVFEEARVGDNAVSYGVGPRKMKDGYAYLTPQKDRVNLGFYQGASLSDHKGLLEGTGKALRHVKVRDLDELPALKALIAAALAERRKAGGGE